MRDPLAVGLLAQGKLLAMTAGEAVETLLGALGTDEARGQREQVLDVHGEQAPGAGARGDLLADETAGLPVLGDTGLGQDRDPEEQRRVAHQRQRDPERQPADAEPRAATVHPVQPREHLQRPAQHRQDQRVEPDRRTGGEAGEHAAPVGLLPVERADHRRSQLGDRGKGDLADGRQAGG